MKITVEGDSGVVPEHEAVAMRIFDPDETTALRCRLDRLKVGMPRR